MAAADSPPAPARPPRALTEKEAALRRRHHAPGGQRAVCPLAHTAAEAAALADMAPERLGCFLLSLARLHAGGHDLAAAFLASDTRACGMVRMAAEAAGLQGAPLALLVRLCIPAAVFFPADAGRAELAALVRRMPPWRGGMAPAVLTVQDTLETLWRPTKKPRKPRPRKKPAPGERLPDKERARRNDASRLGSYWGRLFSIVSGGTPPRKRRRVR